MDWSFEICAEDRSLSHENSGQDKAQFIRVAQLVGEGKVRVIHAHG